MYVFGGHAEFGYNITLYKLHLSTLQWEIVYPMSSLTPSPRDKAVSWFYDKKYGHIDLVLLFSQFCAHWCILTWM